MMLGIYIQGNLGATHLRGNRWAVKPYGQCGTCGFHPVGWDVVYVNAPHEGAAIAKAKIKIERYQPQLAKALGIYTHS